MVGKPSLRGRPEDKSRKISACQDPGNRYKYVLKAELTELEMRAGFVAIKSHRG